MANGQWSNQQQRAEVVRPDGLCQLLQIDYWSLAAALPRRPPIQRHAAPFGHTLEAVQERRISSGLSEQRISSLGLLLDDDPSGDACGFQERGAPDVAVSLVEEIPDLKSLPREIVHVMTE